MNAFTIVGGLLLAMANQACAAPAGEFEFTMLMGRADIAYRVRVQGGSVTLLRQPAVPETEGQTIGLFRMPEPKGAFHRLASLTPATLPESRRIFPDMPNAQVRLRTEKGTMTHGAPKPSEAYDALSKLREEVVSLAAAAAQHPLRAVRVELVAPAQSSRAGQRVNWIIRLSNPGSEPVGLDWSRAELYIEGYIPTPVRKGETPLPPTRLRISEPLPPASQPNTIAPRSSVDVPVAAAIPGPGDWNLRAMYACRADTMSEPKLVGGRAASAALRLSVR